MCLNCYLLICHKIPNSIFGYRARGSAVSAKDMTRSWLRTWLDVWLRDTKRRLRHWLFELIIDRCCGISIVFCLCVELTVLYAAARTVNAQIQLRSELRRSSAATDRSLADIPVWPSSAADDGTPAMLRSRGLLGAVLERRRAVFVETGGGSGRFWDAMSFYTDVMDVVVGWLYRAVADLHRRLRPHDRSAGYHSSPFHQDRCYHPTHIHSSLSSADLSSHSGWCPSQPISHWL